MKERAGEADPWSVRSALYRPAAVLWDGTTTSVWLQGHEMDVEAEAGVLAALGLAPTDGPPDVPEHRHSMGPAALREFSGTFVAEIGTGLVHREDPPAHAPLPDAVVALNRRLKAELDPTGRLNPGRDPLRVVA